MPVEEGQQGPKLPVANRADHQPELGLPCRESGDGPPVGLDEVDEDGQTGLGDSAEEQLGLVSCERPAVVTRVHPNGADAGRFERVGEFGRVAELARFERPEDEAGMKPRFVLDLL